MAALSAGVALWAVVSVPRVPPQPRERQTLLDLGRRLADPAFLRPTVARAAATGALSVGVGFLPVLGTEAGLGSIRHGLRAPNGLGASSHSTRATGPLDLRRTPLRR
jgi:hypothetical protein